MRHLLLAALLLMPVTAGAGTWQKQCDSTKTPATGIRPGDWACYNPTSSTDNSVMIDVGGSYACDYIYGEDTAGAGDDNASLIVYSCVSKTDASGDGPTDSGWSNTGICNVIATLTAAGTFQVQALGAKFIYADPGGITDDTPRLTVNCHGWL